MIEDDIRSSAFGIIPHFFETNTKGSCERLTV
jgi:hypothetical protein